MKFAIFLTLTALAVETLAVKYQCSFTNRKVWFADATFYDCDVTSGSIETIRQKCVESVSGNHLSGYDDQQITSLGISRATTIYMPRGLENYFPELVSIDIYKVGLSEVHQEDLKPYKELKFVSFAENKLRHLEENLFMHNPKLEVILLYRNQIKSVGAVFKNLNNLRSMNFDGNECSSGSENGKYQVGNLIRSIYENCEFRYEQALEYCVTELTSYKTQFDMYCEGKF
ncbi:hypothetical protein ACKWTF_012878 [Chironomus riparius]